MPVREMVETYVRACPPRMLQRRSLVAAFNAAGALPQLARLLRRPYDGIVFNEH
jgi:hypothetical protein